MDIKSGQKYPAGALSNFAPHPFIMDNVQCNSMEGFLQSLKFKPLDMQEHVCSLVGANAKKFGANKNWQRTQTLYWRGCSYKRDSNEYQQLLDRVYESLFDQNLSARKALLATDRATLTHSIGRSNKSETVLTKQEFCSRLTDNRRRFQLGSYLEY